jgi:exonuclease SbcC
MNKLKRLRIKNFQVHKNLEIKLDPFVTTIVGPSDVGKSAIIRAIKWLSTNRPQGDAFIQVGAKRTTVILDTEKHTIKRKKGGATNTYHLDKDDYKAFGNDVPDPVIRALNLSDINFQGQHDNPFWFNDSAGEVSRQLNKIIDLHIIDTTLSNVAGFLRQAKIEETVIQKRLAQIKERRKELKPVREQNRALKHVECLYDEWDEIAVETRKIDDLYQEGIMCQKTHERLAITTTRSEAAAKIGGWWASITGGVQNLQDIIHSIKQYKEITDKALPNLDNITRCVKELVDISNKIDALKVHIDLTTEAENLCKEKEQENIKTEKRFKDKMGRTCPLCGQKIQKTR